MVKGRRVLIGITGGIAAYKVCEVISSLAKAGAEVRGILTKSAEKFITPLTVTTLCRYPAYTDDNFWGHESGKPLHIELGEWAEVFVIAPLTANTLAKLRWGIADNLLTNTVLASTYPILLVPAMNTDMWEQPIVQQNWQQIFKSCSRYHGISPGIGVLACARLGVGRMAEPSEILAYTESLLYTDGKRDLIGKKVLISAGGTREYIDPARFIGNPSTGKMGIAVARAAAHRGAEVTLVHGALENGVMTFLDNVKIIAVTSAEQMRQTMLEYYADADITVMAAAVADVKPAEYSSEKLPKKTLGASLPLVPVPDILAELGERKQPHQILVGFAAQTGDIISPARQKLFEKKLDIIVANPIDQPNSGFGSDTNQAIFADAIGRKVTIPLASKLQVAHHLFDFIRTTIFTGKK